MDQSNHHEYYVERATTSRALAQRAVNPAIAAIHAELAFRYEILASHPRQDNGDDADGQAA